MVVVNFALECDKMFLMLKAVRKDVMVEIGLESSPTWTQFFFAVSFALVVIVLWIAFAANKKIVWVSFVVVVAAFIVSNGFIYETNVNDHSSIAVEWISSGEAEKACVQHMNEMLEGRSLDSEDYEDSLKGHDSLLTVRNSISESLTIQVANASLIALTEHEFKNEVEGFYSDPSDLKQKRFDCYGAGYLKSIPGFSESAQVMNWKPQSNAWREKAPVETM